MKAKKLKQVAQPERKCSERRPGTRFVETSYDSVSGTIQFNVFIVTSDNPKLCVFGGGAFEEKDLQSVAAELSQLAHDFELCDAQAEGYMQAVEEAEKRNE
jgi:hypothetical protein